MTYLSRMDDVSVSAYRMELNSEARPLSSLLVPFWEASVILAMRMCMMRADS